MIRLFLVVSGFIVMFTAIAAETFGKIPRRQAWGVVVIGMLMMFTGIVLSSVLYALLWLAIITVPLVGMRYIARRAQARHAARRTDNS